MSRGRSLGWRKVCRLKGWQSLRLSNSLSALTETKTSGSRSQNAAEKLSQLRLPCIGLALMPWGHVCESPDVLRLLSDDSMAFCRKETHKHGKHKSMAFLYASLQTAEVVGWELKPIRRIAWEPSGFKSQPVGHAWHISRPRIETSRNRWKSRVGGRALVACGATDAGPVFCTTMGAALWRHRLWCWILA